MTNAANTTSHHITCRRCGRPITSARSLREAQNNGGYGRTCAAKVAHAAQTATASATQIAQAVELIEDGAIVHWTGSLFIAVSTNGLVRYEVMPTAGRHGSCSCPAGQYERACYHICAARILQAA